MPSPSSDVLANLTARAALLDLADRGVELSLRAGRVHATNAHLVTTDERAALSVHQASLAVLILIADERTLDRLLLLRAGRLPGSARVSAPDSCHSCAGTLPGAAVASRCGWCALATRLHAGGPIGIDVLELFDRAIVGELGRRSGGLAFDLAVSA